MDREYQFTDLAHCAPGLLQLHKLQAVSSSEAAVPPPAPAFRLKPITRRRDAIINCYALKLPCEPEGEEKHVAHRVVVARLQVQVVSDGDQLAAARLEFTDHAVGVPGP